jgi:hypothetical protein
VIGQAMLENGETKAVGAAVEGLWVAMRKERICVCVCFAGLKFVLFFFCAIVTFMKHGCPTDKFSKEDQKQSAIYSWFETFPQKCSTSGFIRGAII